MYGRKEEIEMNNFTFDNNFTFSNLDIYISWFLFLLIVVLVLVILIRKDDKNVKRCPMCGKKSKNGLHERCKRQFKKWYGTKQESLRVLDDYRGSI